MKGEIDELESQLSELQKTREASIQGNHKDTTPLHYLISLEQRPANEIAHINHEITRTTSSIQLKREASQVIEAQVDIVFLANAQPTVCHVKQTSDGNAERSRRVQTHPILRYICGLPLRSYLSR